MFAQIKDNKIVQVVNDSTLRELYPSTHFPADIQPHHLEGFDGWVVTEENFTTPDFDSSKQKTVFSYDVVNGRAVGTNKVIDLGKDELKAAQDSQWIKVRYNRDNLLKATDYLMVSDVLSKFSKADQDAITAYRQTLRDITDSKDAFAVEYPTLAVAGVKLPDLVRS
jgi:hypothetical protein